MRKKRLSAMLCAAMTAPLLAGCGGGSKPVETAAPAAAETTATADTTAALGKLGAETEAEARDDAASGNLVVVGYTQVGAESDWRTVNIEPFKSTFTEEGDYKLIFDDAQQKQENQIRAIRNFIQQDVDHIVAVPVVETGWETVLRKAQEAGIPAILSNYQMNVDESLYEYWADGNFIKEGRTAGNQLADYLKAQRRDGEDINTVTLQGTIGAPAQVGCTEGFENTLKQHDNWKMLDMQTSELTQTKGQETMESFFKFYDDIDVVVTENDNMVFGAIDAIRAAGKTCEPDGGIIIFSSGAVKVAFDAMIAGDSNVAFECSPLHGPCVDEIVKRLEKGETIEKIQYVDEVYFDTSMDLEAIKAERVY